MTSARLIATLFLAACTAVPAERAQAHPYADDDPLADRVMAAAETLLAERFPGYADRLRVRIVRLRGDATEEAPVRLEFRTSDGVPRGHMQARIELETPDGPVDAGWAVLYVAHYDSVLVANRDMPKDASITSSDLVTAWLDVTTFRGRPLDSAAIHQVRAGVEFIATQPLAAGDVLRAGDLRPPYATYTGETVTMLYRRGTVRLTLPCRAREPGSIGDVVRLHNEATQSTYKARLTAPGEAEWIATF